VSDETYSFSTAKSRLEEIVTQVRKKDTSLEKSLDLLEEGVRLANACTELIDHADWTAGNAPASETPDGEVAESDAEAAGGTVAAEPTDGAAAGEEPVVSVVENAVDDIPDGAPLPDEDAEFASDDDAFGDAADEVWADTTPDFADVETEDEPDASS
jgi:exodeoxyribonuclease VII small subunit